MIVNSRSSSFVFTFPKGFIDPEIEKKYLPYVKRSPIPYDTVHNFVMAQIQSVTCPSLSMTEVSQTRITGKQQDYKNSTQVGDLFSREFTVSFKMLDGYVNYWIMMENILKFLDFKNKELYFQDCFLRLLDYDGHVMSSIRFNQVLFTGMSEITLSYSDNNPDFKTFDMRFKFNKIELVMEKG